MTAATIIAEAFGEDALSDLYGTVLQVPSDATSSQIRKAYHKRALQYHPDKLANKPSVNGDEIEDAKVKFQAVSAAYQILSNDERRQEYDETGELVDDDDDFGSDGSSNKSGFDQWKEYFGRIFPKINLDDIDNFASKYRHSDEERADVLKYYAVCKGDLNKMVECVMCSETSDKRRWVKDYIEPAVAEGDVPRYEALDVTLLVGADGSDDEGSDGDEDTVTEDDDDGDDAEGGGKKRKKQSQKSNSKPTNQKKRKESKSSSTSSRSKKMSKREREAKEAEELIAKIRGKNSGSGGNALARKREEVFDGLISNLESRYGNTTKKKKKRQKKSGKSSSSPPDIPDDEFERIQARLNANRKGKKSRS